MHYLFRAWASVLYAAAWVRCEAVEPLLLRLPPSRAYRRALQAKRDLE
jgi:hypothetical protein